MAGRRTLAALGLSTGRCREWLTPSEDVGAGVGGGQADGGGADDAGVEQGDGEEVSGERRDVLAEPGGHACGIGEASELGTPGEGRRREAEHGRGAEDHDPDPDPQVDPLVVDEPWRDPLVDHIGLLEKSCQGATVVPTIPMMSSMTVETWAPWGNPGTTKLWTICPTGGWTIK